MIIATIFACLGCVAAGSFLQAFGFWSWLGSITPWGKGKN